MEKVLLQSDSRDCLFLKCHIFTEVPHFLLTFVKLSCLPSLTQTIFIHKDENDIADIYIT